MSDREYAEDLDRGPDEVTDLLYGGDGSGDWKNDTGLPWGVTPIGESYYAEHHYRDGKRLVGPNGPWRLRDRLARVVGYHCWECWNV